jgi:hypothetical protein
MADTLPADLYNDPMVEHRSTVRWSYTLGSAIRVAALIPILIMGFSLLFLLDMGNQIRHGSPVLEFELTLLHLLTMGIVLFLPITIAVVMAESVALLVHGLTKSVSAVVLLVPLAMAILGQLLATAVFVDPEAPDRIADRLFSFGGPLLFFLAGSLQVWAWQEWNGHRIPQTPMAWYASALLLTAGFLGSMIAWHAPSPYVREVNRYYRERWEGKPDPRLPTPTPADELPI